MNSLNRDTKPSGWEKELDELIDNDYWSYPEDERSMIFTTEKIKKFIMEIVTQAILSAEKQSYKRGLDDMFIEISKLAESDERQFGAGDLNCNLDDIHKIRDSLSLPDQVNTILERKLSTVKKI